MVERPEWRKAAHIMEAWIFLFPSLSLLTLFSPFTPPSLFPFGLSPFCIFVYQLSGAITKYPEKINSNRRHILANSFRGVSPWLLGCIASGPAVRQNRISWQNIMMRGEKEEGEREALWTRHTLYFVVILIAAMWMGNTSQAVRLTVSATSCAV